MGWAYQVMNSSRSSAPPDSAGTGQPFETVADKEMSDLNQAYLTITITASAETREAADKCTGSIWRIGNAAMSGDEEVFNREVEDGRDPIRTLRAAMRHELGIE